VHNRGLAADYVQRAVVRLEAIDVLYAAGSWADVVCESQEAVELALKGVLRACGVDPPRVHDVSEVVLRERERLLEPVRARAERLAAISRDLRRDRELAFYGAEDLVPSEFYVVADARRAREGARLVVESAAAALGEGRREPV